jgi:hypothetical protein
MKAPADSQTGMPFHASIKAAQKAGVEGLVKSLEPS